MASGGIAASPVDTFGVSNDNLPVGTIPLFATSSPEYKTSLSRVIVSANNVYQDFLKSPEAIGFCGQICLVGDSVGAILAYDALCIENTLKRSSSDTSVGGAVTTCRIPSDGGSECLSTGSSTSNPRISGIVLDDPDNCNHADGEQHGRLTLNGNLIKTIDFQY